MSPYIEASLVKNAIVFSTSKVEPEDSHFRFLFILLNMRTRKNKTPETPEIETEIAQEVTEPKIEVPDLEVAKKMLKIHQSAMDRKLEFNLSFETVKKLLTYRKCYYTGRIFAGEGSLDARSFDRKDSSKGYIEGNVVSCTVDINQKKSNLSFEEISCLYHKLLQIQESQ
jgi:hypothetical protein